MKDLGERLLVLDVKDGDVLVCRVPETLTSVETASRLREAIEAALAQAGRKNVPVLILPQSFELEALRALPGSSPFVTAEQVRQIMRDDELRHS